MKQPLISIITVVYNGVEYLEDAIKSVISQSYPNIEFIVIDGGSKDGSVEVIKKYSAFIEFWISEPDRGIYDAMNKGIKRATGDIIGLLNSDDMLADDILTEITRAFEREPIPDYIYGSVERMDRSGKVYGVSHSLDDDEIDNKKFERVPFQHQSLYLKREIYEEVGLYDTRFAINGDYDFMLRLLESEYTGQHIKTPIVKYRDGGLSGGIATFIERKQVWKKHGIPLWQREWNAFRSIIKLITFYLLPSAVIKKINFFSDRPGTEYYDN